MARGPRAAKRGRVRIRWRLQGNIEELRWRMRSPAAATQTGLEDWPCRRTNLEREVRRTDSIQLEQRSQEGTNRLPRCLCGGCIVADMWVALDAFVLISEGAVSRSVSQPARFVLAYATSAYRLRVLQHNRSRAQERIVKRMRGIRVLGQRHVATCHAQPLHVSFARRNRIVVIRYAAKDPDRAVRDVGVAAIGRHAVRIERDIAGKVDPRSVPHLLKSLHAREECPLASTRKAHEYDTRGIDTWVFREHVQHPVDVENHVEAPK